MRLFEAILIFTLGNEFVMGSSILCKNIDNCTCYNTQEGYQFQCPSSDNFSVVIRIGSDKHMTLECVYMDSEPNELILDSNILPNYKADTIEEFELSSCSLTRNDFLSMVKKFGIETVKSLSLKDIKIRNNSSEEPASITKYFFQGLSSLRTLDISSSDISIDVDAFENLSNLTKLYLDKDKLKGIGGMFDDLKDLSVLHLSRNFITNIPNNTFQTLGKLKQLHLWGNNVTRVTKHYFTGLRSLQSLELSENFIQVVDSDAFSELPELSSISLIQNQLSHVSFDLFRLNKKLYDVRLNYNPNITLDDYVFANFKNLTLVSLEKSRLQTIPDHIFEGSENLRKIKMQNNLLQEIPEKLFSGLKNLEELYLGENRISSIPDEAFSSLINLKVLDLEDNLISQINRNMFKMTRSLRKVNLNNNKIKTITVSPFSDNENMPWKHEFDGNPFQKCLQLEEISLKNNLISVFPASVMFLLHLTKLDLSQNKINSSIDVTDLSSSRKEQLEVNLSNNLITELYFPNSSTNDVDNLDNKYNNPATTVLLHNNMLICDCGIYDLVLYINGMYNSSVKTSVDLQLGETYCASPESMKHTKIKDLRPKNISCPYLLPCRSSRRCECLYRPFDKTVVVDCSFKNLTECPRIEVMGDKVEMNLVGNAISNGPDASLGYDNVTNLILSYNKIQQFEWIPRKSKIVRLDGNHLRHLNSQVLGIMKNSSSLTLSDNPWTCDCSATEFQNFIRKHDKILESKEILCEEDNEPLIAKLQLCEPISSLILKIAIPIFVIFILAAAATILFFKYEQEIEWWLFEHGLWHIPENELDKDKQYDIFISFSHKDEDFVVQSLLSELEQNPNPFKTCIHMRDWRPGLSITENIANSVNDSRRTLVVLSNDFLDSIWGKMEFRAAHIKAIEERRARVIVVKYGELDEEKLDNEIKMYLKTNTYVEWGKPWFWRQLRFALPHSHPQSVPKTQKHANMMLNIDDKFELTSPPLSHPESTPPVVSLDPSSLKCPPVSFEYSPAETPLVVSQ